MKLLKKPLVPIVLTLALIAMMVFIPAAPPSYAASPPAGAMTATAGAGGVTTKTFVKLSAAGRIIAATAVTDSVIGVCEQTADANAITKYAQMGTRSTVTSGETIAVGDLLTTGTGGKAFVLDADDASTQRVAAMALTAAGGADVDVTVVLGASSAEQRQALATLAVGGGYGSTGATISAAGVIQANGAITSDGAVTGGTLTDGTVTVTSGAATGTLDISGATVTYRSIINADISASADIARSKMVEEALAVYGVPFQDLRNDDGTVMDATGGAGLFSITSGGFGTGTLTIDGEAASNNSKTDTLQFEFILPPEYVAAGDVKLVLTAKESVGAATVATTLSAEMYESDGQGAVGSDLYNAFDVTDITASWQTCTSVITASGLQAGDRLIVFVRIVTNDTGGAVGTIAQIGKIELQLDIKG